MSVNSSYYAMIPSRVRYCNEISVNAKLVYAELNAITLSLQLCISMDELYGHFKESMQMSQNDVDEALDELKMNYFLSFDLTFDNKRIFTLR